MVKKEEKNPGEYIFNRKLAERPEKRDVRGPRKSLEKKELIYA